MYCINEDQSKQPISAMASQWKVRASYMPIFKIKTSDIFKPK